MEYHFLMALLLVLAFFEFYARFHSKKLFYILVAIIIVFVGTRNHLGTDIQLYESIYGRIQEAKTIEDIILLSLDTEYFFNLLCLIAPQFWIVTFVFALLSVTIKAVYIKQATLPFLSLSIYFCFCAIFYDMGIMRQGLALGACLYSIKYIEKHQFLRFSLLLIFSMLFFHRTSIFFVPAYFIYDKVMPRKLFYFLILICFIIGGMTSLSLARNVISFFPTFFSKFMDTVDNYNDFNKIISASEIRKIIFAIFFYEVVYLKNLKKKRVRGYVNLYTIGVCMSLVFIHFTSLSSRGAYYYCFFEIFLIPILLLWLKKKFGTFISYGLIVVYCFLYLNITINQHINTKGNQWQNLPYIPYKSVLFKY